MFSTDSSQLSSLKIMFTPFFIIIFLEMIWTTICWELWNNATGWMLRGCGPMKQAIPSKCIISGGILGKTDIIFSKSIVCFDSLFPMDASILKHKWVAGLLCTKATHRANSRLHKAQGNLWVPHNLWREPSLQDIYKIIVLLDQNW